MLGTIVLYNAGTNEHPQMNAAIVAHVYPDATVNLMVIDGNGHIYNKLYVFQAHGKDSMGKWQPLG